MKTVLLNKVTFKKILQTISEKCRVEVSEQSSVGARSIENGNQKILVKNPGKMAGIFDAVKWIL